ncbi:MAG: glycosyltransferase family 39 protein [Phycisphaerales bacterium]|nr:glycosyltransferase family 39 protein [Phycisphaerales bacterium]
MNLSVARKHALLLILILAAVLRAYHVTAPPIGRHSWRQTDTAAIARNFQRNGFDLLHPQCDWGGDSPGYVAMELPIYPFAVAVAYEVFFTHEAFARLLAMFGSLVGVYFLFRLVEMHIDRRTAIWSCLFYAILPLNIYYSRTIQPEAWMIAASIAGIYFFSRWTETDRRRDLLGSACFVALACVLKLALYLGLPLLYLAWRRYHRRTLLTWRLWAYAAIAVLPTVLWYMHAYDISAQTGLHFGVWNPNQFSELSMLVSLDFYNKLIFSQLAERHFTWVGFVILIVGLCLRRKHKGERLFDLWIVSVVIFFLLTPSKNYYHEYYQLPLIPPACVFLGKVFARGWAQRRVVLAVALVGIMALSIGRYVEYMRLEDRAASPDIRLAAIVRVHTEPGDLIVTVRWSTDPTWLYLSDRKGWALGPAEMTAAKLDACASAGAVCVVTEPSRFKTEQARADLAAALVDYEVLHDADDVLLVDLTQR